jgi:hypothetical protein
MGAVGLLNLGAALVRCYPPPDMAAQAAAVFTPGSAPTDAQLQQIVTNNLGPLANTLGTLIAVVMWGLGIWWLTVRSGLAFGRCRPAVHSALTEPGRSTACTAWTSCQQVDSNAMHGLHHPQQVVGLDDAGGSGQRDLSVQADVIQHWVVGEWHLPLPACPPAHSYTECPPCCSGSST